MGWAAVPALPFAPMVAIQAARWVLASDRNWIPPTLNWEVPEPACDLDVVPQPGREAKLDYVLSNSFGFGGINACVVLGRVRV